MVLLLFVRSVLAVRPAPSQILAAGDSTSNLDDEARPLVTRPRMVRALAIAGMCVAGTRAWAQGAASTTTSPDTAATLLLADRVFDGTDVHDAWGVLVRGERIVAAGPVSTLAQGSVRRIALPGTTLLPGLIEGHSHLLLHPYNEAAWSDQVLHEPLGLRIARATNHARETLRAGFT